MLYDFFIHAQGNRCDKNKLVSGLYLENKTTLAKWERVYNQN